jgi:hypothetical protein
MPPTREELRSLADCSDRAASALLAMQLIEELAWDLERRLVFGAMLGRP